MLLVLVEDDAVVRELLAEGLRDAGWDIVEACSAEEALLVPDCEPHFVVTDINLGPGMDGLCFIPFARKRWPNIGVIFISGRPLPSECLRPELRERFLRKPFSIIELCSVMGEVAHPHPG